METESQSEKPTNESMDLPSMGITEADLDQSDLSDKEDAENFDLTPFRIDWLDLQTVGLDKKLGIAELPGCRYKNTWRSLRFDVGCLKKEGIEEVFCLCTKGEFFVYRTKKIFEEYTRAGLTVHQRPIEDGDVLSVADMMSLVDEIKASLLAGRKTLLHCHKGLGRSCTVAACLLMSMDENVGHEEAIKRLREVRGPRAIYSVKQFNYVNEFEENLKEFRKENKEGARSVSR